MSKMSRTKGRTAERDTQIAIWRRRAYTMRRWIRARKARRLGRRASLQRGRGLMGVRRYWRLLIVARDFGIGVAFDAWRGPR